METKAEQEPVAWRFKNNPSDAWEYRAYPPSGVGPNAVIEPLYGHPWTLPKIGVYDPKTGACNEECDCVIGQICRGYIAYSDAKNAPK